MAYQQPHPCPTCGTILRDDDRNGADWECRRCRCVYRTAEVVL